MMFIFFFFQDPLRAVEAGLHIHDTLQKKHIPCGLGITTGRCFCGNVGTLIRREYAMVGNVVVCEQLHFKNQNI